MKRLCVFIALAGMMMAEPANASPKADSIKAYTGAARVKFVWDRVAFCDETYTPLASPKHNLMLFDTDEGVVRALDGATQNYWGLHSWVRISRSAKWAMWNEGTTTWDIDLVTPNAVKQKILDKSNCTFWCGRAFWIDSLTGTEYVFSLDGYQQPPFNNTLVQGTGIYKMPFDTKTGTVDPSKAVKINIVWASGQYQWVDDVLSVSADGKKLGSAFPWPDTEILDLITWKLDYRHVSGFGCQANLAPDNSYRFFHCDGDHYGINMFEANLVDKSSYINLSQNLVFFGNRTGMDFSAPRWSNNVQFISNTCPMDDNFPMFASPDNNVYLGHDATWVKTKVNIVECRKFILQKFTSDFNGIESSIALAADIRNMEHGGDAWLSNGVTGGTPTFSSSPIVKAKVLSPIQLSYAGGFVTLNTDNGTISHVKMTDSQGRLVRRWDAHGTASFDVKNLSPGTYCVAATSGELQSNKLISIAR